MSLEHLNAHTHRHARTHTRRHAHPAGLCVCAHAHTHTHMHTQYRFMDVIKRVNSEAHIFARVGSAADFKRTGSSAASNVVDGGVFAGGGDAAGSAPLPGGGGLTEGERFKRAGSGLEGGGTGFIRVPSSLPKVEENTLSVHNKQSDIVAMAASLGAGRAEAAGSKAAVIERVLSSSSFTSRTVSVSSVASAKTVSVCVCACACVCT